MVSYVINCYQKIFRLFTIPQSDNEILVNLLSLLYHINTLLYR